MRTTALAALAAGVLLLGGGAVGGCTAKPPAPPTSAAGRSPAGAGPACLTAAAPPAAPVPSTPATAGPGSSASVPAQGDALPALTLPCLVGGHPERLSELRGPAVINLWASWCQPCLQELPAIDAYARRADGTVRVVGIVTDDPDRSAAQSFVDELGLRFPMLYDKDAKLRTTVAGTGIPRTLLIDRQGRVVYKYLGKPLDEAALAELVHQHLGVPPP